MKKIVLGLLLIAGTFASKNATAQTFSVDADTVKASIYGDLNLADEILNTTSTQFQITWNISSSDFPASWTADSVFGICDNKLCRSNTNNGLFMGSFNSDFYMPGIKGDFHVQLTHFDNAAVVSGTHYLTVTLKNGADQKNITFSVTKFATGLTTINRSSDNIVFYPNPATSDLNVIFDRDMDVKNITVYNLIGKAVTVYKVNGSSAKLDISNMPSGIYFMRLMDPQGRVVATRKFTHQ